MANAQFRITDASPSCADLIGVRPDALIGEHLIDAIPDREIADAVMTCLSAIRQSGEERTVVAPGGRPYEIAIAVARSGRDQPIRVTLTAERAGA